MTNPIIKPTVGRVVWFHPSELTGEANFARHQDGQPYAAIIARVWSNAIVNLTVFDASGTPHPRTSVKLWQGDGIPPGTYCEWMPYQKGQAAKTEAAEKSATEAQPAYHQRTQREELEYTLVSGAASHLAQAPSQAKSIAEGIKAMLDALHPAQTSVSNIPSAAFGADPEKFGVVAIDALPVVDPGPDSLEREIQAKANKAPRVTPADIEAEIASEHFFTGADGRYGAIINETYVGTELPRVDDGDLEPLELLTFCVLVLQNGTKVVGINHGAIDPAQHSAERGRIEARKDAVSKCWELLGFRLRDELARPVLTDADAAADLAGTPRPDNPTAEAADFLSGRRACNLAGEGACEACQ